MSDPEDRFSPITAHMGLGVFKHFRVRIFFIANSYKSEMDVVS